MKILIVEDDAGISDFVISELEHEGYTTSLAVNGREALVKFENEKPDLILLDIMLPELNGLEVLRRIRAVSTVPVILETARGETIDKINGLILGPTIIFQSRLKLRNCLPALMHSSGV